MGKISILSRPRPAEDPDPPEWDVDWLNCVACNGDFFYRDNPLLCATKHILLFVMDDGDTEEFDLCPVCASYTPTALRRALEYRTYEMELEGKVAEDLADTFLMIHQHIVENAPDKDDAIAGLKANGDRHGESAQRRYREAERIEQMFYSEIVPPEPAVVGPRAGHVYLIGSPDGYCKIGRAKHLSVRLVSIGLQLPYRVELIHSIEVNDMVDAERCLHQKFAAQRMNGEWFLLSLKDIDWIRSLKTL